MCKSDSSGGLHCGAMTEALVFAEQVGLDKALVLEVIGGGAAGSWAINNYAPRILKEISPRDFMHETCLKTYASPCQNANDTASLFP